MSRLYAGVEIGGTKQQIAVADETGRIVKLISEKIAIPNGAPDILAWIEPNLKAALAEYPQVEAVGVGFGGPMESVNGRVTISVQVPGWKDFEIKTWFTEKFGLPTTVVVDTVAGGYAELLNGAGRGSDIFFYSNIGTGIGGAMYMHGRTYDGIGFGAAYMGNTYTMDITRPGELCRVEELCAGVGIERQMRAPGAVPESSRLYEICGGRTETLTCKMLGEAAAAGDRTALDILDRFGQVYGLAIANTATMFSPDRVAIGGGVANLGELLLEPIRKYAEKYVFISAKGKFEIVQSELLDMNVLVGAVLYARDGFVTV